MIEKALRHKIEDLITRAPGIANVDMMERTDAWQAHGEAWVTEAVNAVELTVPDALNAYRNRMRELNPIIKLPGTELPVRVPKIAAMLRSLLADLDAGLVGKITTKIQAETFDNFLDHAVAYRDRGEVPQAGVIAGAVFEDTVRKIYADKLGVPAGKKLDELIAELTKQKIITEQQARQARTAAFVRTKASHAEWRAFDMDGVDDTIKITKTLLKDHLM